MNKADLFCQEEISLLLTILLLAIITFIVLAIKKKPLNILFVLLEASEQGPMLAEFYACWKKALMKLYE
jgi:hypothetical protein